MCNLVEWFLIDVTSEEIILFDNAEALIEFIRWRSLSNLTVYAVSSAMSACEFKYHYHEGTLNKGLIDLKPKETLLWLLDVFEGENLSVEERCLRFGEESIELTQALRCVTREQWHALVDQVYDKDIGEPGQELGGVLTTLSALCAITNLNPSLAFDKEFERCRQPAVIEKIRDKHRNKKVVS